MAKQLPPHRVNPAVYAEAERFTDGRITTEVLATCAHRMGVPLYVDIPEPGEKLMGLSDFLAKPQPRTPRSVQGGAGYCGRSVADGCAAYTETRTRDAIRPRLPGVACATRPAHRRLGSRSAVRCPASLRALQLRSLASEERQREAAASGQRTCHLGPSVRRRHRQRRQHEVAGPSAKAATSPTPRR